MAVRDRYISLIKNTDNHLKKRADVLTLPMCERKDANFLLVKGNAREIE